MRIRHSEMRDLPQMMKIFEYARNFMAETGNPNQWGPNHWPPEQLIVQDIEQGKSYVCVDETDTVLGTFFFVQGADAEPDYRVIDSGSWKDPSPYGVVHRIASGGREKGVGTFCLNWAYEQCGHLRIDTHEENLVMRNLLKKLGFEHCGTIYVRSEHSPRLAYEKSADIHAEK